MDAQIQSVSMLIQSSFLKSKWSSFLFCIRQSDKKEGKSRKMQAQHHQEGFITWVTVWRTDLHSTMSAMCCGLGFLLVRSRVSKFRTGFQKLQSGSLSLGGRVDSGSYLIVQAPSAFSGQHIFPPVGLDRWYCFKQQYFKYLKLQTR